MQKHFFGKTALLICFLQMLFVKGNAQLIATLQVPAYGIAQKSQLWNMMLINPTTASLNIQIELSLYNSAGSQKLLSAVTRVLEINKGARQIQYADVVPVNYNYLAGTDIDRNPYGFLPVGYYKACYSFSQIVGDMIIPLAEECTELEVAPLSPPQLLLPEDKARVDKPNPQFTWIAPLPEMLFRNLVYTLRVVELFPGQGYTDAMERNIPVVQERNLKQAFFDYPASARALERNKKYLWQVTAHDGTYSVKTEIWLFEFPSDVTTAKQQTSQHVELERGIGPAQFISNGLLKFRYQNELSDTLATFRIYPPGREQEVKMKGTVKLKRGENFVDLSVEGKRFLQDGGMYCFALMNSSGEKWFLPFVYYTLKEENHDNQSEKQD